MPEMTALVWEDTNTVEPRRRQVPEPAPGETLLRVHNAGICGSDLGVYAGVHPRARAPLVMGHEFSGEVVRTAARPGEEHSLDFAPGDRVVVEPLISCGHCRACRSGMAYVCENLALYGIDTDGAFAEFVTVSTDRLYRVPDHLDSRTAALTEPTAVAVHAVRRSSYKPGDSVVVLGGGPIGTLIALVLKLSGCEDVVVSEPRAYRLSLLRELGIRVIDASSEDPVAASRGMVRESGADIVFEVAGVDATAAQATAIAGVQGNIVIVAVPKHPLQWDDVAISFKELTLTGTRVYAPFDFERALGLLARNADLFRPLLSEPFSLEDGGRAFEMAKAGEKVMRAVFEIGR
jgi:2-desacetyl-2-hydroxyethyl bacteriochlorophyllide A dehydrogenase